MSSLDFVQISRIVIYDTLTRKGLLALIYESKPEGMGMGMVVGVWSGIGVSDNRS